MQVEARECGAQDRFVDEAREERVRVSEQRLRRIVLGELPRLEEHDGRRVHDGVQSVGDRQDGALLEGSWKVRGRIVEGSSP